MKKQQSYKFISVEELMSVPHVGRKEDFIIVHSLEHASLPSMIKVKIRGNSEKKALSCKNAKTSAKLRRRSVHHNKDCSEEEATLRVLWPLNLTGMQYPNQGCHQCPCDSQRKTWQNSKSLYCLLERYFFFFL